MKASDLLRWPFLAGVLLLGGGVTSAAAETPIWAPLTPPRLDSPVAVYDSQRDRDLVVTRTAVWAVSRDPIPLWTRISTSHTSGTHAVYDAATDRIWCFSTGISGGAGSPGRLFSMDLADASPFWTPRSYTGTSPGTLGQFAMAYDPTRNRVVLFGGLGHNVDPRQDVYLLSLNGTPNWSKPTIAGTLPSIRYALSGLYDSIRDRMIVFGGHFYPFTSTSMLDEAWALSMSTLTWTFLEPRSPNPPPRERHVALLDSLGQRMVVFSGSGTDTWAMDLAPSVPVDSAYWEVLSPDVALPASSLDAAWLERPTRRLLRYGRQLWGLNLAHASNWMLLADSLQGPTLSEHVAMVDGVRSIWSIGLGATAGGGIWSTVLGSTERVWARPFDTAQPWRLAGGAGPGPRYGAGAVADPPGQRALIFGGAATSAPTGTEFADLWSYHPATETWNALIPPATPTARADALTLYDPTRRRVIVHGGRYTLASRTRTRDDTWAYDVVGNSWAPLAAGSFGGRWNEVGIYDPVRDRLIVFGGKDTLSSYSDVHQLSMSGGTWTALPAFGTPPASIGAAAYDPVGDRMLVFADNDTVLAVHALSLDASPTWTTVASDHGSPPRRGEGFAMAVEPGAQRILISGGVSAQDEGWVLYPYGTQTPTLASFVSSHAAADRVRIVWQLTREATEVVAWRRTPGDGWSMLAPVLPEADGRVTLDDHAVEPGRAYEYRLHFRADGQSSASEIVSVLVPLADAFRLEGPVENPVSGKLFVRFSLGFDPSARIDLLDLAGRRVISRPVGSLGPGTHSMGLTESERLPAGLYFLQLRHAEHILSARVTLLR